MFKSVFFPVGGAFRGVRSTANVEADNQAHLRYRPDIDGLRAVAVLPVVFYHSALGFPGGFVGVDVFFVISGYLITKIIYDLVAVRGFSFVDFYDRRVRRLFPALFVMLLAVAMWSGFQLIWTDLRSFGASLVAATTYLSNVFFYADTGYFVEAARTKPLLHTWSLAVEEQFYIVVPFLLFALVRFVPSRFHVWLIAGLSILSFALCVWFTRTNTNAAFYLLPMRAWELGLGGGLAIAAPAVFRRRWLSELLSFAGLAAILFAVFGFSTATPFPGWHAAIPTLGTAAILSTGGRSGALVERLLSTKAFTFVGQISYSLYLWHWPVIVAFTYARITPASWTASGSAVAISFVLAVLSWRYVESPFRRRQLLASAPSLFRAAAFASLVTVACGLILYRSDGLPQRYSPQAVALLKDSRLMSARRDCHFVTSSRAGANDLCVRGAAGVAPAFLFAGDSHADALSDGLFEAARRSGTAGVQFSAPGFVPLPGRRSLTSGFGDDLLPAFEKYLRGHPDLRTIIITSFWAHEATGRSYRHLAQIFVDSQYDGSGAAYNPRAFRHALEKLVREFPSRQFILLDDVPSGDVLDLANFVRAHPSGRADPRIGLPRAAADEQRATYEPILRSIAASNGNVRYAPVLSRLCGPEICPLFRRDGVPIYRNGDHLSRYGSLDMAGDLEPVFKAERRQPPLFKGPLGPAPQPHQG